MPTYEYVCENCGHKFEQFQTITAKPLRVCPKCGKQTLNRLIGAGAGIIFKGSGFYQTDYRSESYKKASASDKKTSETKSDKKPSETKDTSKTEKPSPKTKEKT
jgi:putative FmdB family regulatory protein